MKEKWKFKLFAQKIEVVKRELRERYGISLEEAQFISAVEKMKMGDKEGLREIYQAYISYIYSIVYQIIQNKENAEDVTSEFFLRLWEKAGQYNADRSGHRGYLATIARNMSIDFLRKNGKEQPVEMQDDSEEDIAAGGTVSVEQEVLEELSMKEALEKLEVKEREIVHLKIVGELTFQEIAGILAIPLGTVTWKYQNALKKLRRCGYHE